MCQLLVHGRRQQVLDPQRYVHDFHGGTRYVMLTMCDLEKEEAGARDLAMEDIRQNMFANETVKKKEVAPEARTHRSAAESARDSRTAQKLAMASDADLEKWQKQLLTELCRREVDRIFPVESSDK